MKESFPEDKRVFPRSGSRVNLKYRIIKSADGILLKNSPEHFTITKDLSAGGLCFIATGFLPVGTILEVKIELLDSAQPLVCLAKVLYAQRRENDYYISVHFLDILSKDRIRLEKYVKEE